MPFILIPQRMNSLPPRQWICQQLYAGQLLTIDAIQRQTGISLRQIRRIFRQLKLEGLEITEHWQGRLKVFALPAHQQQVTLSDLAFDPDELRALTIATKASQSVLVDTPYTQALQRAFSKLLECVRPVSYVFDVDEPLQEWHFDGQPTDHIAANCFRQIETSMDERQAILVDYQRGKDGQVSTGRKLDPYFFAKRNRTWLLIAFCHQRREVRTFALSRISRVVPCPDAYFELPTDFSPEYYFRSSLGAITAGECYELRLLVEPEKSLFFRQRTYHPTQLIEEELSDGRLVVSFELEGLEEMRSFCQSWGTGITVLSPDVLRERLLVDAQTLLSRYLDQKNL